jgi:hypothetical protein
MDLPYRWMMPRGRAGAVNSLMKKKIDIAWNKAARIGVRIVMRAGSVARIPGAVSVNWEQIANNTPYEAHPSQRFFAFRLGGPLG